MIPIEIAIEEVMGYPGKGGGKEWRYGRQGSLSWCLRGDKAGLWFDFESDEGGDLADYLVQRKGYSIRDALDYLADRGLRDAWEPDAREQRKSQVAVLDIEDLPRAQEIYGRILGLQRNTQLDVQNNPMDKNAWQFATRQWFELTGSVWRDDVSAALLLDDALRRQREQKVSVQLEANVFGIRAAREFFAPIDPPSWIVPGFVQPGQVGIMYGPTMHYKSALALDMACHLAFLGRYRGKTVGKKRVLYCFGEGQAGISKRLQAWCAVHNLQDPEGELYCQTIPIRIMDSARVKQYIAELLARFPEIDLIIIDTYNTHRGGGEENSNDDYALYLLQVQAIRDATSAAIMTIDHTGKDLERGIRGASSKINDSDFVIEVFKPSQDAKEVTARLKKAKDVECGLEYYYDVADVELQTSDGSYTLGFALKEKSALSSSDGGRPAQVGHQLFDLLTDMCTNRNGPVRVLEWRDAAVKQLRFNPSNWSQRLSTQYLVDRVAYGNGWAAPVGWYSDVIEERRLAQDAGK